MYNNRQYTITFEANKIKGTLDKSKTNTFRRKWVEGQTSKYIFLLPFQDGEKVSNKVSGERRSSGAVPTTNKALKIGNSHTSVIESTTSLYSNDDRRSSAYSSRIGVYDEQALFFTHFSQLYFSVDLELFSKVI